MTVCFTTDRMLRFGDCDISGTAYYPAYMNILNGVVEEFWTHIGWPWHEIIWKERWGTPTVHLSCDFSKPSFFGDKLTFRLTVLKVGKSSLRLAHTVHCGEEHRWSVEQVLAASWLDSHTSMVWPEDVKAKLESLMGPAEVPERRPVGGPQAPVC
ncbi:MAG: thioesterase family protein [Rhodobacteraceae bacterium]|nr:thioesterase family protein [Paracoccaceae bacterium]MCZ8082814.1 thioesterase family protein [Paracoccaceae bacterium]